MLETALIARVYYIHSYSIDRSYSNMFLHLGFEMNATLATYAAAAAVDRA